MSRIPNHIHRYKKVNIGANGKEYWVYRCQKPSCTHYIPLHLVEGKLCECNRCHEAMIMGKAQLRGSGGGPMSRPHCNNCIERKVSVTEIADYLKEVGE